MGHVGRNVADAVIPMGLPPTSVVPLIGALMDHKDDLLFKIPGVTGPIVGAGGQAIMGTFSTGFKHVWIAAACFVGLAAIRTSTFLDPQTDY